MGEARRRDWRDGVWPEDAGSLLRVTQVAVAQEHLLAGFEGRHPEVGAAGTAESIAQVALLREEMITHTGKLRVRASQIQGQERDP